MTQRTTQGAIPDALKKLGPPPESPNSRHSDLEEMLAGVTKLRPSHPNQGRHMTSHTKPRAIPAALTNFPHLPDDAYVRQPVVEGLYSCSSATVWRNVKKGIIPAPRKLSERVTAWNVGALRKALGERGL